MALFRRETKTPQDEFAAEMAALVRKLLGVKAEIRSDFSLSFLSAGGKPVTMNLDNIYAEARRREGDDRVQVMRRSIRGVAAAKARPQTWDEAAPMLLPAVRAASWAAAAAPAGAVRRSFLPFVQLLTAIDFPDSMSFVTSDDLRTWAVTQAEAERAAVANLTSQPAPVGLAGPVGMVMGPDGYASSWLAAPTSLAGVTSERFGPDPVIIAVGRDQVRVVDSTNAEAITAQLTEAIDAYREEPRQLSPVPYSSGATE